MNSTVNSFSERLKSKSVKNSIINNTGLSPGTYILKTTYIVYKSRIDTIVIKEPSEVMDSEGNKIKIIPVVLDCLGQKTCPDPSDLIYVPAGKTINYPPTKLTFFSYKNKLKSRYSIVINYEFDNPKRLTLSIAMGNQLKNRE